ncbi:hydrolase, alpha/beta fold family [mine drainage metagenome]|uniref:Hydrolase, alpha/beta fold family n=1 Tax=mine drainage metagenome TaxID=410659 RepID=T1CFY8_9ZZZZ
MALLLPGYGLGKATLLPYALLLAQKGFVSVLVDLPGQGDSGGRHIGYGFLEAGYMKALTRYLYRRDRVCGQLILIGLSYGAAVALDDAALHPRHLTEVVAIAPFARIVPTIARYAQRYVDDAIPARRLLAAIRLAEHTLGYRFSTHDPLRMVPKIRAKVIYVVGANDQLTPLSAVKRLVRQTPNARLVVEPALGHESLITDTELLCSVVASLLDDHTRQPL